MGISNKLEDVSIEGKYVGGNDHSINNSVNISVEKVEVAKALLHDIEVIEAFSISAQKYLSEVASEIANAFNLENRIEDEGLDEKSLLSKFENMKCSQTYISDYNEMSAFFHVIDNLATKDSTKGGSATIRTLISLIKKLYMQFLNKYETGDEIHNVIVAKLMKKDNQSFFIAANIFVYYIVRGCGIFNEKK